ncbi:membrane protein insertion efficiency factor YidD [Aeromonas veronii]|uniref:membrane protein insertion efficiency factor YidD n=1 Tax=Aeromonas veronii TaxID=654 RepID=UPI00223C84C8|nr:membrane protein insertion efficiency factor YidD [Aeromonas veronii]
MLVFFSIRAIYFYRAVAPKSLRSSCRFNPSCSEYALLALRKYGFLVGWRMTLNRIYRCQPPGGGDDFP